MDEKFREFTGGMSLWVAAIVVGVVALVLITTAGSAEWVVALAFGAVVLIAVGVIRLTGVGR